MDGSESVFLAGVVGADLVGILKRVAQDAELDIALDVSRIRLGFEPPVGGFAGEKGHQIAIFPQRGEDPVVGFGQLPGLFAGIVPGGDIPGAVSPLVGQSLLLEVEGRVEVGNPVEEHAGLVGVGPLAADYVGGREVVDASQNQLFPLPVHEVGADKAPAPIILHIALSVVDAEAVSGVVGLRVLGVEQQRSVPPSGIEDALPVQGRAIIGMEIVLRKEFGAMGAAHLPGNGEGVDLPGVHRGFPRAVRAETIRPDHPRARDGVAEHHLPQLVVTELHPRLRPIEDRSLDFSRPRKFGSVGAGEFDQLGGEERTAFFCVVLRHAVRSLHHLTQHVAGAELPAPPRASQSPIPPSSRLPVVYPNAAGTHLHPDPCRRGRCWPPGEGGIEPGPPDDASPRRIPGAT